MSYEPKANEGVLFKNDRKEKDTQPDYTGSWHDSKGDEYFLSAWINESQSGKKYMSVKLGDRKTGGQNQTQAQPAQQSGDFDQDIPF